MLATDSLTDPAFTPRLKVEGIPSGKMAGTTLLSRMRLTLAALGEGFPSVGMVTGEEWGLGQLLSARLWPGHRYNTCLPSFRVLLW